MRTKGGGGNTEREARGHRREDENKNEERARKESHLIRRLEKPCQTRGEDVDGNVILAAPLHDRIRKPAAVAIKHEDERQLLLERLVLEDHLAHVGGLLFQVLQQELLCNAPASHEARTYGWRYSLVMEPDSLKDSMVSSRQCSSGSKSRVLRFAPHILYMGRATPAAEKVTTKEKSVRRGQELRTSVPAEGERERGGAYWW